MEEEVKIISGLIREDSNWYYYFGREGVSPVQSAAPLPQHLAEAILSNQLENTRSQFSPTTKIVVERKDLYFS